MLRHILTAALLVTGSAVAAQDGDASDPELAFNNNCRTCHSRDEGDNRLGPNLHAIVGREAGSAEGYGYSDALAKADFAWDEETLDAWIANPDDVVTGHKMEPYDGISDEAVRGAIIEALKDG